MMNKLTTWLPLLLGSNEAKKYHSRVLTAKVKEGVQYYMLPNKLLIPGSSTTSFAGPNTILREPKIYKLENGVAHAYYDFLSFDDPTDKTVEKQVQDSIVIRQANFPRGTRNYLATLSHTPEGNCFSSVVYAKASTTSAGEMLVQEVPFEIQEERSKIANELENSCKQNLIKELAQPDESPPYMGEWVGNLGPLVLSLNYNEYSDKANLKIDVVDQSDHSRHTVQSRPDSGDGSLNYWYRVLYVKVGNVLLAQVTNTTGNYTVLSDVGFTVLEPQRKTGVVRMARNALKRVVNSRTNTASSAASDVVWGPDELASWRSV